MARNSTEELVYVETADGVLLEGAVIRPAGPEPRPPAIVWVHGLTGRFYSPMSVTIGRELAGRGFVFVTGNNRGHDFGTLVRRRGQPVLAGGGWERFEESPYDVAAWTGYAAGLGGRGVVLLGHSLGALKVAYYQAERQDRSSPPAPASSRRSSPSPSSSRTAARKPSCRAARSTHATLWRISPGRAGRCTTGTAGLPVRAAIVRATRWASWLTETARPVPILNTPAVQRYRAHRLARTTSDTCTKSRVCAPSP